MTTTVTDEDRKSYLAACEGLAAIEREREALVEPTRARWEAAKAAVDEVVEIHGEPICCCEACGVPVFEGEPYLGGETPLCGPCAPTYCDLVVDSELLGFVMPGPDDDWVPMTVEYARALYDSHLAAGGLATDSMAK